MRPTPIRRPGRARRYAAASLGAVVLSTGLAACGDDADSTEGESADGGEEAGSLVVYVGRDEELVAPLIEQFTEDSGIEVEARYADTSEHLALLMEEGDQTPADVFLSQDAGALGALAAEGNTRELSEDITGAVEPDYTSQDGSWVGVTGRARVIAYNADELEESEVPGTVEELTAPEWSGRVGFPPGNASFQAFVTGFREAEGDDAARAWLESMVENDAQTFESNGDTLEAIETGVVDVGLINHYYVYERAAEMGEDEVVTELRFPEAGDPGALVNVTGAAILSDQPEAEEFVSYLVSEEGQTFFVENTFEYPLVPEVEAPEGLPALDEIEGPVEDLAELADLEATVTMIEEAGLS
jgi:iron(III) transport system substrate-binding protein